MPSIYSSCPKRSALVWNASWVHRSESVYGLACKLGTANSLRIEEALGYFSQEAGPKPPAYRDWRGDTEETSAEGYRSLRYCPICLRQAFHSIFQQHRSIRYYPIHAQDLIEFCPYCHELMNPYWGRPWHCSACELPLTEFSGFEWLAHFSAYPDGGSGEAWLRSEQLHGKTQSDAGIPQPMVDADYWRRNIRRLGRWYFEELQFLMRRRLSEHLDCALGPFVENRGTHMEGSCAVAQALWDCANLIWATGTALVWPNLNRRALGQLELHIFPRIFVRAKSAYLGDEAAELAVSEAVSRFFAAALERRLSRKQERFYRFNEMDEQELWSAAARNEEFRVSTAQITNFECSCPAETRIPECSP